MYVTYIGPGEPLEQAFLDQNGDLAIQIQPGSTSSNLILYNTATQITTVITGSNLPTTVPGFLTTNTGTVTGWASTFSGGAPLMSIANISWSFPALRQSVADISNNDDYSAFYALMSLQPVTFDASGAVEGLDFALEGVTSGVTFLTTAYSDTVMGGSGNDVIEVTGNVGGNFDEISGSNGNDRYEFQPGSPDGYIDLIYSELTNGITVSLSTGAGTGTVDKGPSGTDTLNGLDNVTDENGTSFAIWGTVHSDTFEIDSAAGTWIRVNGGAGVDTYDIDLAGTVRISLGTSWNGGQISGVVINLATGVISNDGFGNTETLNVNYLGGTLQIDTHNRADSVTGSSRDEVFILRGGDDTLYGGGGWDLVRFDRGEFASGVNVNLATNSATGVYNGTAYVKAIYDVDEIRGSSGNDTLTGDAQDNSLNGGGGNDRLFGGGGADGLYGGSGDDSLYGGEGRDWFDGGAGNDYIQVGPTTSSDDQKVVFNSTGNDTIDYSSANPTGGSNSLVNDYLGGPVTVSINGSWAENTVTGSHGTTVLQGLYTVLDDRSDGFDVYGTDFGDTFNIHVMPFGGAEQWINVVGGRGSDTFNLTLGGSVRLSFYGTWDTLANQGLVMNLTAGTISNDGYGFADQINVVDGAGRLTIDGTTYADSIRGSARGETFITRGGNDTINGEGGYDIVRYDRNEMNSGVTVNLATGVVTGSAYSTAFTQRLTGIEEIRGTRFADGLYGSAVDERLRGNEGNDTIYGYSGNDTIEGGDGFDYLAGGVGNDIIYGGDGNNTMFGGLGSDSVYGGEQYDEIYGGGGGDLVNYLYGNGGADFITAGSAGDLIGGGAGNDTIRGGDGADTIYGGLDNDNMAGGGGHDVIYGAAGSNIIWGGAGNDTVYGGTGTDTIYGGPGRNNLLGNDGHDVIYAGTEGDFIGGGAGNDSIYGGDGADTIYAGLNDDFIGGGGGHDYIVAGAGTNRIYGGIGNDTIVAGTGKDVLTGSPGIDHFVFQSTAQIGIGAGRDVITDFTSGEDKINLQSLATSFNGTAGFGAGPGASFYYLVSSGLLIGDQNGDKVADWVIELQNRPATVLAGDFLL